MAPSTPLVASLLKVSLAWDESSMLQMPVVEKALAADEDECRCPGYYEDQCRENAHQGCIWTDAGESNSHWCQCDPNFVPPPPPPFRPRPPVQEPVGNLGNYYATMGPYPGYSGDLNFAGVVNLDQSENNIILSWHLSGLEAQLCATPPEGVANACGIHIHSGSTCDDGSGVGGHYYHEDLDADPWSPVVYTPDASGGSRSAGNTIAIGHDISDVVGRAIVVHDHTGGRVACGIIHELHVDPLPPVVDPTPIIVTLPPIEEPHEDVVCCMAMTASCLSCSQGISEEEFCASNPGQYDCEPIVVTLPPIEEPHEDVVCCMAMTASCLSCSQGISEEEFCASNPGQYDCEPIIVTLPPQPEPVTLPPPREPTFVRGGQDGSCPAGTVRVSIEECPQLDGVTLSDGTMNVLSNRLHRVDCAAHFVHGAGCFVNIHSNVYSTAENCPQAQGTGHDHWAVCKELID